MRLFAINQQTESMTEKFFERALSPRLFQLDWGKSRAWDLGTACPARRESTPKDKLQKFKRIYEKLFSIKKKDHYMETCCGPLNLGIPRDGHSLTIYESYKMKLIHIKLQSHFITPYIFWFQNFTFKSKNRL